MGFVHHTAYRVPHNPHRALILSILSVNFHTKRRGAEIYRGVKSSVYVEIPSFLGHIACCPGSEDTTEYVFITDQLKRFLADLANAN